MSEETAKCSVIPRRWTSSSFDQERLAFYPDTKNLALVGWAEIDIEIVRQLVAKTADTPVAVMRDADLKELLLRRGLLWPSKEKEKVFCSPAGILLFAKDPTKVYPQSCIRLVAFQGNARDPRPSDSLDIAAPIPKALEQAIRFIDSNTRHPFRVEGLQRVRLDEYPIAALREALINAMAHRNYEDAKRKIHVELFSDHVDIVSPGLLPDGISLDQLRSGKLQPCSRNPVIAQGLRLLGLMEELGTGVVRMKQTMIDHGLKPPEYSYRDNCLVVSFRGPGENIDGIKTGQAVTVFDVRPSVAETLTQNQKTILHELLNNGKVQVPELAVALDVTVQAVRKDLAKLQKLKLIEKCGAARATYYVLKENPALL